MRRIVALALVVCAAVGCGQSAGPVGTAGGVAPPAGPSALAQYQAELQRQLSAAPAAYVPPAGPGTRVAVELVRTAADDDSAAKVMLRWPEALPGDFNLDGACDFGDLVELSNYNGADELAYGQRTGRSDRFQILDSNRDGIIGLGDVLPLAQHYLQRADAYRVERRRLGQGEWRPLAGATVTRADALAESSGAALTRPLVYTCFDTDPLRPAAEYRVVPLCGAAAGAPGWPCPLYTGSAPAAYLDWGKARVLHTGQPYEPPVPAGAANGYERYRLDLDGDSVFEGLSSSFPSDEAAAPLAFTPEAPGELLIRIVYEDSLGRRGFRQTIAKVVAGNALPALPPRLDLADGSVPVTLRVDEDRCLDPDGDELAFAYELTVPGGDVHSESGFQNLPRLEQPGSYLLRVTADDGTATAQWDVPFELRPAGPLAGWRVARVPVAAPSEMSAAALDGRPALAFTQGEQLYYMAAADPAGQSWPVRQLVFDRMASPENEQVHFNMLRLLDVSGRPALHLSYDFDHTAQWQGRGPHYYTVALDEDGTGWTPPAELSAVHEQPESVGAGSLALIGGRPALAYIADKRIAYLRALDRFGIAWPAVPQYMDTTDPEGGEGFYFGACSLVEDRGLPLICAGVSFIIPSSICSFSATAPAGGSWTGPRRLGFTGNVDLAPLVIAGPAGRPLFQLFDARGFTFTTALGAGGAAASPTFVLPTKPTSELVVDSYCSAVVGSHLGVAYFDPADWELRYCESLDAYGSAWGAPQVVENASQATDALLLDVGGRPGLFYWGNGGAGDELFFATPAG